MSPLLLIPLLAALDPVTPPITAAAFTPDGKQVVVGSQSGIELFSWPALQPRGSLPTRLLHIHDLEFSPEGTQLAAAGGRPAESGEVELFGWPGREPLWHTIVDEELIYQVGWRSDGEKLAAASGSYAVTLCDSAGTVALRLQGHSRGVLSVAFLSGDSFLVSAGIDRSLRIWNLAEQRVQRTLNNHTAAVHDVAIRPGNSPRLTIASAGADRTVRIWWPLVGRLVRFAQLASEPLDIDWTPDGNRILAACRDGRLRVIDPETVELLMDEPVLKGWAYTVAAAGDGHALVAGADGQLRRVELRVDRQ